MKVVGIVGGVASGKSAVARALQELGAHWIDADRIASDVLALPQTLAAARGRWGQAVVAANGRLDRKAVADRIFAPTAEGDAARAFWESMTHPEITRRMRDQLQRLAADGCPAAVLDAPLLFRAGWDGVCDAILFVDAPYAQRWERAQRRGWTEEEFQQREAAQLPLSEKRRRSTFVIDNGGDLEETYGQVQRYWDTLSA